MAIIAQERITEADRGGGGGGGGGGVASPSRLLNIPWKWSNLVSPNYFIFMGYQK